MEMSIIIGGLIGFVVGVIINIASINKMQNAVDRYNENRINAALGRRATYKIRYPIVMLTTAAVAAVGAVIGAVIKWFMV